MDINKKKKKDNDLDYKRYNSISPGWWAPVRAVLPAPLSCLHSSRLCSISGPSAEPYSGPHRRCSLCGNVKVIIAFICTNLNKKKPAGLVWTGPSNYGSVLDTVYACMRFLIEQTIWHLINTKSWQCFSVKFNVQ